MHWQAWTVLILASAYWLSATGKGLILRWRTGKSAHPWPKPRLERALIIVWVADIAVWIAQPVLILAGAKGPALRPLAEVPWADVAGAVLGAAMLALSWLAWGQMGDSWRLGTHPKDRTELVTTGLFARIRHPIYALQGWLLIGCVLMLPTPLSAGMAVVHLACILAKSSLEERHLLALHGEEYARYRRRVGAFWPRLLGPAPEARP